MHDTAPRIVCSQRGITATPIATKFSQSLKAPALLAESVDGRVRHHEKTVANMTQPTYAQLPDGTHHTQLKAVRQKAHLHAVPSMLTLRAFR
jgi:hypothetical protein